MRNWQSDLCAISKEYVFVDFVGGSREMGCGIVSFYSAAIEIKEWRAQMRSMLEHRLWGPRETTAKKNKNRKKNRSSDPIVSRERLKSKLEI